MGDKTTSLGEDIRNKNLLEAKNKLQKSLHEKKVRFNEEVNRLFDQLVKTKDEKISNFEATKDKLIKTFDTKINELYKRRDLVAEVFSSKRELRRFRRSFFRKLLDGSFLQTLKFLLSMPFIYLMIIPIVFFHVTLEVYHRVCFRLYGIPVVRPGKYFIFDRKMLPHLNWLEKFNCFYCSYYNGLISYAQEIGGRTERYWCPIKHARRMENTHSYYEKFVEYSDAKNLRNKWDELRKFD